jgi:cysteine-rich repeat protein
MLSKPMFLIGAMLITGCLSSREEICGDGSDGLSEQCDDSNTISGDGCSDVCSVESGFACFPDPLCVDCVEGGACVRIVEDCANSLDDDRDGAIDCEDSGCNQVGSFFVGCAEGPADSCTDGADNDLNGLTDCDDQGCINDSACPGVCGDSAIGFGEACDGPSAASCSPDCQTVFGSEFVSAADVLGDQPDEAVASVIFGESGMDFDNDGIDEARGYLVLSSDDPNECAIFDLANGGLTGDAYVDAVFAGTIPGNRVFTAAIVFQDPGVAAAGDVFVGDSDVNGDGLDDSIVDAGFIQNVAANGTCSDGRVLTAGGVCNDTTFGGRSDGVMTISSLGATIDGGYSGFQQTEFVGPTENLNIGFNGTFQATRCADLEAQVPSLLKAALGL